MKANESQYNQVRAQYARSLGFDPENLTEDQLHQVEEALSRDGVLNPNAKALPGGEINPTAGNEVGTLTKTTKGKATSKKRNAAADGSTAGAGSREASIKQLVLHEVEQGREVGALTAAGFAYGFSETYNGTLDNFFAGALNKPSTSGQSIEDFLSVA